MNRAYLFNCGSQFESVSQSPWNPMMQMPEDTTDTISRPIWSIVSSPVSSSSQNKLNMPIMEHFVEDNLMGIRNSMPGDPNLPSFGSDPGFAERAAKFSCFGSQLGSNLKKTEVLVRTDDSPVTGIGNIDRFPVGFEEINNSDENKMKLCRLLDSAANSNEESSVSEQISNGELGFKNKKDLNSRKRRSNSKKEEDEINDLKRLKKKDDVNKDKIDEKSKLPEPPKDYIHVRARRGQATDSHSLAERVRREKISERMNLLQNLVPNCNKVTGKALMLDEIINYVQSLQRQVEFLSMKLATVNPSLDIDTNDLIPQNDCQSSGNVSHQTSKSYQHNPQVVFNGSAPMNLPVHDFNEPFSHILGFGQDDLQSIVRMGFRENLDLDTSFLHTTHSQPTNMKMEL